MEYCTPCSIGYNVILHFEKLKVMTLTGMIILDALTHFKVLILAKIPIINADNDMGYCANCPKIYDKNIFNKKASFE